MPSNPVPDRLDVLSEPRHGLIRELFDFLRESKKFWMLPILLVLAVFGVLMLLGGTAAAPFIYTLF